MSYNGIDVSNSNGYIDWKAVAASGIRFAIIRSSYGDLVSQKDAQFENNIKGALANNLKVGIYHFSYAVSVDDAIKEAEVCNQIIMPYKSRITMGVYFDWEYDSATYYQKIKKCSASKDLINQMNIAFINKMKSFGYKSGIYFNADYKNNMLYQSTLNTGYKWLAYYSGACNGYDIQQTSPTGHVNGISGAVDLDVCYNASFFNNSATTFKSDTSGQICVQPMGDYTFKITANGMPNFVVGNSNLIKPQLVKQQGNDYFFKIQSTGVLGSTGIYICNSKNPVCVVNVKYLPFKCDTGGNVNIKKNQCYQAKITCVQKPSVCCADPNSFRVEFVKQCGSDWYFKFYAIGNIGKSVGIYINGSKQPTFIGTIIA